MAAKREVKAHRVVISNTTHMFKFCEEKLKEPAENETTPTTCIHKKRWFALVKKDDVKENPPSKLDVIEGTRKIHSLIPVDNDTLSVHHFTCFCHACRREKYDACEATDHVQAWQKIKPGSQRKPKKRPTENRRTRTPAGRRKKTQKQSKPTREAYFKSLSTELGRCTTFQQL